MARFKAVIFDLDGTIIDTEWIWQKAKKDTLTKHNVHLNEQEAKRLEKKTHSVGLKRACSILKEEIGIAAPVETLANQMAQQACQLYKTNLNFIPGFQDFHKKVCDLNLKSGIATSAEDDTLGYAKQQLNLELFFGKHIYGITKVNFRYKPDPAIYLLAAEKIGVAPQDCIVIEDSGVGVTAAQRAGMFCIGINSAGIPEAISHADFIVDSYDQIDLNRLIGKKGE